MTTTKGPRPTRVAPGLYTQVAPSRFHSDDRVILATIDGETRLVGLVLRVGAGHGKPRRWVTTIAGRNTDFTTLAAAATAVRDNYLAAQS